MYDRRRGGYNELPQIYKITTTMLNDKIQIIQIQVTALRQNCRIVVDVASGAGAIVDPGGDVELIIDAVKKHKIADIKYVLLTHAHFDHAGGVGRLLEELKRLGHHPQFAAHKAEATMRAGVSMQAVMFCTADEKFDDCPEPEIYLEDGDVLDPGENVKIKALLTPGHSPGHLSFLISDSPPAHLRRGVLHTPDGEEGTPHCVITGDALFNSSIGRTDLPGSNHNALMASIRGKLLTLPENILVMPGHGPDSTIGNEIRYNPFLM